MKRVSPKAKASEKETPQTASASKGDVHAYVVLIEWTDHHDLSPDTTDIVGVYTTAEAANNAVLEFCSYVWHDHPQGQKLHDAAAKRKGLLDLEFGDGSWGEGEHVRCWVEKKPLKSS